MSLPPTSSSPIPATTHPILRPPPPSSTTSILENPHYASIPSPLTPLLRPRTVTLRDGTLASIHPYHASSTPHLRVNPDIVRILAREFDEELERGDTYPLEEPMGGEKFEGYWFGSFGAVMVVGAGEGVVVEKGKGGERGEDNEGDNGQDWEGSVLGSFYVKPNYPGRSSHICNAGFLTTHAARNRGCGKKLGEAYLEYAPKLGYVYSIFNLVYETNTASLRIWDSLGFERIGRVKGAGRLKSYPGRYVDAVIYGRDLMLGEVKGEGEG